MMGAENKAREAAQPKDYSDETRYNRGRALGTALLKWLQCEFFGLFIFLSLLAMRVMLKTTGDIIFGLAGLVTYVLVMADFGIKEGGRAHTKNIVRGDNVGRGFGLLIGLVSITPPLISLGLLGLSRAGIVGNMLPAFKALNTGLWGLINLFVSDMDMSKVPTALFAVYPAIQLLLAGVAAWAFCIGLSGDDLQTRIMYKKSK